MGLLRLALVLFSIASSVAFGQGGPAAAISLDDTRGQKHTIQHFAGRPGIVHFWATWCSSCLTELPQLIKLADEWKAQGLSVILIATDSRDATQQYMRKQRLDTTVLIDQYGKAMRDYQVQVLPTSIFIDAKGNVIGTRRGRIDWDSSAMRIKLQTLLAR